MYDVNRVWITGTVGDYIRFWDEKAKRGEEEALCKFKIKIADFIETSRGGGKKTTIPICNVWGELAYICKDLKEGDRVAIEGKIYTQRYRPAPGRSILSTEILVENLVKLEPFTELPKNKKKKRRQSMVIPSFTEAIGEVEKDLFNIK
jgi:single-stranded DNA-binding protein